MSIMWSVTDKCILKKELKTKLRVFIVAIVPQSGVGDRTNTIIRVVL